MNIFFRDLSDSIKKIVLPLTLGKQDIGLRYKRSILGPFWITINILILSSCLSFVFGFILKQDLKILFPHLFFGLIFWNFLTQTINDGCIVFSGNAHMLQQVKIPYIILIFRVLIRNTYILIHNAITFPIIIFIFNVNVNLNLFLFLPNFLLVLLLLFFLCIIIGIFNARFRDVENIVQNLLNVCFYLTPIFWSLDLLKDSKYQFLIVLNPFYHLLELLRAPFLGLSVSLINYLFVICLTIILFTFAMYLFLKFKKRIVYWI